MKFYLLLIFLFTSFTEAQIDTSKIQEARRFLFSHDIYHYPYVIDKINGVIKKAPIEQGLHFYGFNHEIDSPLKNTNFLFFRSIIRDPNPHYLIGS
ncbi:MAG: hypothetical protein AUJ54_13520 [Ignavibacteria bacterium CG1_02_37_35]|nr:MAG: hypothetical protein AUJ54_13520 [Ignavibacteria bacterium CG1_02_37_35]